jgi:hypothetical protein
MYKSKFANIIKFITFISLTINPLMAQNLLPICQGNLINKWNNCRGEENIVQGNLKEKYTGEFKHGQYNGLGTYNLANGDKYSGEFKNGLYHGRGTYTFADGRSYFGEYKNDKKNGKGIMRYSDGSTYDGNWKDGLREGEGTLRADGRIVSKGLWVKDKYAGDSQSNPAIAKTDSECSGNLRPVRGLNGCEPCEQLYYDGDGLVRCNPGSMTIAYEGWAMELAEPGEISIYDSSNKNILLIINNRMKHKHEIGSKCKVQYIWNKDYYQPKAKSAFCIKSFQK